MLDFIFKTRGIDYVLCDDFVAFERLDGQRLNYSDRHFENVKKILPSPLLFDQKIKETIVWYIDKFKNDYFKNNNFKYRIGLKI